VPKFQYGEQVILLPLDRNVPGRVVDLHMLGSTSMVEYDVRYFLDGKASTVRVFEDELQSVE
jgi:uncharacterized protein YcfJ